MGEGIYYSWHCMAFDSVKQFDGIWNISDSG